jgi:hypothetical protein
VHAAALAVLLAAPPAVAEELIVAGGVTDTDDHTTGSYAWALDYRQRLLEHLDVSLGYLNEGHIPGHHRDGMSLRFWGRSDFWQGRVHLAVGAGPYVYCDTQTIYTVDGYRDYHGVGAMLSASAGFELGDHWFIEAQINQELVPGNEGTHTLLLGVGYRLDRLLEQLSQSGGAGAQPAETLNEVGVFVGETVLNGPHVDETYAFGAEYRRRAVRHLELSASLLDEGEGVDGRHLGVTASAWLVQDFFARRITVGAGLGVWESLQSYRTIYGNEGPSSSGLVSMTFSWRFARAIDLRAIWHRAVTNDDQDRDIVTLGIGWGF